MLNLPTQATPHLLKMSRWAACASAGEPLPPLPPQGLRPLTVVTVCCPGAPGGTPSSVMASHHQVQLQGDRGGPEGSVTWPLIQKGRLAFLAARKEELKLPFQL